MESFTVLDQAEEDKLHATRLLGIEERPFKRLTKRLLAPTTPIQTFLSRQPAPTPNTDENDAAENNVHDAITTSPAPLSEEQHQQFLKDLRRFRDDVILDFAAFESSIARIQFLRTANEKERERYAVEKIKIESTAHDVRENTSRLRGQLDEAQRMLAVRKTYDVLADEITKDPALKPRDEQHANIEKLKVEIEELERESVEHSLAWVERRDQLSRVVVEGSRMRRLIRDEKEPEPEEGGQHSGGVSRDRERDGDGDADDEERHGHEDENENDHHDMMLGVDRDQASNFGGTPRPHDHDPGSSTPMPAIAMHESGAMTPRSTVPDGTAGAATPQPETRRVNKDADIVGSSLRIESHPDEGDGIDETTADKMDMS